MGGMERLIESDAVARLRSHDASLFTTDYDTRSKVMQRLGWTDLAEKAPGRITLLNNLASQMVDEGCDDIVLLGMGGSSLAPLVIAEAIGSAGGMPRLHVLDTTCPRTVLGLLDGLKRDRTFVVIASKSGTTVEPLSLYSIVRGWLEDEMRRPIAGRRCIAITDPGSALEKLRVKDLMRVTLGGPPTVGGRFSALSMFGLAPAAMIGVDLPEYVRRAHAMEVACSAPAEENPSALLAAWIFDAYQSSRDKLTLACSPDLRAFGLWAEQLVAESTGKDGTGVVPVLEDDPVTPAAYGDDRCVVVIRRPEDSDLAAWADTVRASAPLFDIVLDDSLDLGAEFVRWEHAVALLGHLMAINPFDEPDVSEAKRATSAIIAGTSAPLHATDDVAETWVTFGGDLERPDDGVGSLTAAVSALVETLAPTDYLTMLAYLPYDEELLAPLRAAWRDLGRANRRATCFELGPRYLHSTGQLHKGGPDTGAFVMVTARDRTDSLVPGEKYTLGALFRAQAEGDMLTLAERGRRVVRFDLPEPGAPCVGFLAQQIRDAIA